MAQTFQSLLSLLHINMPTGLSDAVPEPPAPTITIDSTTPTIDATTTTIDER